MNITTIVFEARDITPPTAPVDNAIQHTLRLAIERIRRVGLCRDAGRVGLGTDGSECAVFALSHITGDLSDLWDDYDPFDAAFAMLSDAAAETRYIGIVATVVHGGLAATEAMFARAIALAATP